MHARAIGGTFPLNITTRYTKESSSSGSESALRNYALEYDKSQKLTFEISI